MNNLGFYLYFYFFGFFINFYFLFFLKNFYNFIKGIFVIVGHIDIVCNLGRT
jgi:hypothetical protein